MHHTMKVAVLGILAVVLFTTQLEARHIIGGEITYECLGNGDYEFTMKIYRDCNCSQCAQFDDLAFIAIYECEADSNCVNFSQSNFFARLNVPLDDIRSVEEPTYDCLEPPNVCVEEGLYTFRLSNFGINLPLSEQSYHIVYQRCCRNETISNIINPDDSGATYTVSITPEAQQLCNNSPTFSTFPPTIICGGFPLEYDHSATDVDGDQLVYSFQAPLLGGGPLLDEFNYTTCEGANPDPACPPPFDPVRFVVPTYTFERPLRGNPIVEIDPNTGLISGTPQNQGQFVVGVCVEEFRNGVFLSKICRDFQFNVASCDPQVTADIAEDEIIDGEGFLITSCGSLDVPFINQSFRERFITSYEWRFFIDETVVTIDDEWSPTVSFPRFGDYEGKLVLNPGTSCSDSADIRIQIFPDITANFGFEYDTCVAGPVVFTDSSFAEGSTIETWSWNFGDGNESDLINPLHTYRIPGDLPVSLTIEDDNGCVETATKIVSYFPVPNLIVIAPSSFQGCVPSSIFFNNLSFPIDETYDIFWDFGDGGSSTAISPTHLYTDPGTYTVNVDITSPIGCLTDTSFSNLIQIDPAPTADFEYNPEEPSNLNPNVDFTDLSEGAVRWFWDFGTGFTTMQQNPSFSFPDTGLYNVTQIVTHPSGCMDTIVKVIDIIPDIRYHLPNAFTPNNDSVNDEYFGKGILLGVQNFDMTIWNRWGEMIFQTSDPTEGWNGQKNNAGEMVPNGVYVVLVSFRGPRGGDFEFKGYATVIR